MKENKEYTVLLESKGKSFYIKAKGKAEARKKAMARLQKAKASSHIKIYCVEEGWFYYWGDMMEKTSQVGKEQAIKLSKEFDWNKMDDVSKFLFQISQKRLCMDFSEFHKATEKALQRAVWTHEFAKPNILIQEFFNLREKATLKEIMHDNLDPKIRKKMLGVIVK